VRGAGFEERGARCEVRLGDVETWGLGDLGPGGLGDWETWGLGDWETG